MRQSTCTRSQAAQPRAALRSMTHLQSAADAQHSHGVAANLLHNSVTINARDGHHLGTGSRAKSHHQGLRVINTRVYVDDQFHTTLFTLFQHFLPCQRSSLKEIQYLLKLTWSNSELLKVENRNRINSKHIPHITRNKLVEFPRWVIEFFPCTLDVSRTYLFATVGWRDPAFYTVAASAR